MNSKDMTFIKPKTTTVSPDFDYDNYAKYTYRRTLDDLVFRGNLDLVERIKKTGSKTFLDIGCGTSLYGIQAEKELKSNGYNLEQYLLDNDPKIINYYRSLFGLETPDYRNESHVLSTLEFLDKNGISENDLEEMKKNFHFIKRDISEKGLDKRFGKFDYSLTSYVLQYLKTGKNFHTALHNINNLTAKEYAIIQVTEKWKRTWTDHLLFIRDNDSFKFFVYGKKLRDHINPKIKFYITEEHNWANLNARCSKQ